MKRLAFIAAVAGAFLVSACTQTVDTRHKIEVLGSAETEVTPDIIYVGISIKEFIDKASGKKALIEDLEARLRGAVAKAGIPKENFRINDVSSFNYAYERKKNPAFMARKQYRLKVSDLTKFNHIINAVDAKAIEYTTIEGYDYSNLEALKQDLKIKALKAAKDKATALAASLDDQVGEALEINEIENGQRTYPARTGSVMNDGLMTEQAASMQPIDFKTTKLSYQIRAVFELE
ncbi:SIMPL domain-containing protein [Pedobacter sp. P351]|uniref:SIMPL domain-containing protein n=1 Tax=Pedobacter superstes TaxID=3133441 RepID=UPI0030B32A1D